MQSSPYQASDTVNHARLDTRHAIETPEGALLPLTPAGFMVRCLAQLIDILIRSVITLLVFFLFSLLGKSGVGIALILAFLLEWFYPVFFEITHHGRTPGKKWLGIRVVPGEADEQRMLRHVSAQSQGGFGLENIRTLLKPAHVLSLQKIAE